MVARRRLGESLPSRAAVEHAADQRAIELHHGQFGLRVIDADGADESTRRRTVEGAGRQVDAGSDGQEADDFSAVELYPPIRFPGELPR